MAAAPSKKGRSQLLKQAGPDLNRFPNCAEMRELVRSAGRGTSAEELKRAQTLAYDAWEEDDRSRRNALARRALAHSPICADAWLQLSQLRNLSDEIRREYLMRAVCAGELAIGESRFAQDRGEFWLVLETRPYMRARHALAEDFWFSGARQEAINHLREMLELNANDNQGLRYVLLTWLIRAEEDQTAQQLLDEHGEEISTFMEFTRVLLAYKATGDSEQTRSKAANALLANRHVAKYLAYPGLWYATSDHYSPGQESEAAWYAQELGIDWHRTPGAIAWLVQQCDKEPLRNRDGETLH